MSVRYSAMILGQNPPVKQGETHLGLKGRLRRCIDPRQGATGESDSHVWGVGKLELDQYFICIDISV